jgi:hypothetical protein
MFVAIVPGKDERHQAGLLVGSDAAGRDSEGDRGPLLPGKRCAGRPRATAIGTFFREQDHERQCGTCGQRRVDGPVLSVKYKDGEKKLVVTPQTVVVI